MAVLLLITEFHRKPRAVFAPILFCFAALFFSCHQSYNLIWSALYSTVLFERSYIAAASAHFQLTSSYEFFILISAKAFEAEG